MRVSNSVDLLSQRDIMMSLNRKTVVTPIYRIICSPCFYLIRKGTSSVSPSFQYFSKMLITNKLTA